MSVPSVVLGRMAAVDGEEGVGLLCVERAAVPALPSALSKMIVCERRGSLPEESQDCEDVAGRRVERAPSCRVEIAGGSFARTAVASPLRRYGIAVAAVRVEGHGR